MKQKIIATISGLAVVGFLGKGKIMELKDKYMPSKNDTEIVGITTDASAPPVEIDTILEKSMKSVASMSEKNMESDSMIFTRVEKTVTKIEKLNHEVKVLKKENRELRAKLNDTDNVDGHFSLLPISE
jgi:hypothetical protein